MYSDHGVGWAELERLRVQVGKLAVYGSCMCGELGWCDMQGLVAMVGGLVEAGGRKELGELLKVGGGGVLVFGLIL